MGRFLCGRAGFIGCTLRDVLVAKDGSSPVTIYDNLIPAGMAFAKHLKQSEI